MQPAATRTEPAPRRKLALNLLRIVVSGALIALLVAQAGPRQIWQVWQGIDLRLLALALLLQLLGIALSAAKWGVLLRARGQAQPFRWLFGLYLIGQFASNFLPTVVGGDAVRVLQLGRRIGSYSAASASVFLERLTGFLALAALANLALLALLQTRPAGVNQPLLLLTVGFGLAALAALLAVFWAAAFQRVIGRYLPAFARAPLQRVADALTEYAPRGGQLVLVLALSLLFQCLWIGLHAVCGLALGLSAPLLIYTLMATNTDMVGLAPIFVNNLGAREMVFLLYLSLLDVGQAQAVGLALLIFGVRLLVSVLGGLVVASGWGLGAGD
ncbi:MAG: hypothetical protein OHK0022_46980 [Roseiflexaceae bacterium]